MSLPTTNYYAPTSRLVRRARIPGWLEEGNSTCLTELAAWPPRLTKPWPFLRGFSSSERRRVTATVKMRFVKSPGEEKPPRGRAAVEAEGSRAARNEAAFRGADKLVRRCWRTAREREGGVFLNETETKSRFFPCLISPFPPVTLFPAI